jgi:hypothetical protein
LRSLSLPSRLLAGAAAIALVALIVVGVLVFRGSADAAEPLAGNQVSDADLRTLATAAASCPTLTPARLAGQVMVASSFSDQPVAAMSSAGATGTAALTAEAWKKWAPWPGANATDRAAAITALAHDMCQMAGQIRVAGVEGDPWQLALAAYKGGPDAVVAAGGVPAGTHDYVDTVGRYETWYAQQPGFGASSPIVGTSVDAAVVQVPDEYLAAVVAAGQVCSAMPPVRIAAQIMATSAFDPRRLGPTGEQGIAQFRPQTWLAYAPSAESRSPWNPSAAIPALGKAMCALIAQSSGAYEKALAVFTHGDGGVPVTALAGTVTKDEAEYTKDARLKVTATPGTKSPAPGASATPTSKASSSSPAKAATVRTNQPPIKSAGKASYGPYFIYNFATKECADFVGNTGQIDSKVDQFTCDKTGADNQQFTFVANGVDGAGNQKYLLRNTVDGLCIDLPGEGTVAKGTQLQESNCWPNDNQSYRLEPRFTSGGFQYYRLRNTAAGDMCLDVTGPATGGPKTVLTMAPCVANDDHEWALVEKSEW